MNDELRSEAAGRMTLRLALSLYRQASAWLRDALERNAACSCGACHLCAYRYLEQNTRPQPAPPAGEPDFAILLARKMFGPNNAVWDARWQSLHAQGLKSPKWALGELIEGRDDFIAQARDIISFLQCLGLPARPKVEDGEVTDIVLLMREKIETLQTDLRTKETQLAQADAALAIMDDFVQPNIDWEEWISEAFEAAQERHQSRQQAAKDKP